MNWVANRHVITNYMHSGHTRYTSTLLNINNQYAHDFYQSYILWNKIKNVYDNIGCPGKLLWCFFVNGNVFFSQHILNKATIHT